ncbi:DHH family phosphoesterase [Cohnella hashimotonis]|uniref:Bifunctional oligoribonuclease/PAP phosphatase NrnA n=1 Tax=Cohnella hashimotonis TaxID=2826895 RepID=A0ABT6TJZ1_9BACL|nr:bifunctional oligoribonuclease/PAP phosphatase NrnA [Cohnella hashimotonis]MDI4646167.1 bifunctional oligoribonuclease/PAP phosphatase NrnA [Cohnella hashimotonis]
MNAWTAQLDAAVDFIRERDDFLVVSHVQPDGDAISSTVAVAWLLGKLGKSYAMYNEGPVPERLHYLIGSGQIETNASGAAGRAYRHVIAVDCADFSRVGNATERFEDNFEMLNIDHHPTNNGFGLVNLLRSDAAATAEILFELIERAGIALDKDAATAIYTGMLTDTGGFRYSNTTPNVLAIASRLIDLGVDGPMLAELLLERMTLQQMLVLQRALSRLTFSADKRIAWLWVTPEDMTDTGAKNEDLEGIVNFPRNVEGVEVGILFKQNAENAVKVSLRSAGKVDVAAVSQQFGGGGHVRAAGCRVEAALEDAIGQMTEAVGKALESHDASQNA